MKKQKSNIQKIKTLTKSKNKTKSKTRSKTRKDLAVELYHLKLLNGESLVPIGRKTRLSEEEFTKRYLNGIGGSAGFKKNELASLIESYKKKIK